MGSQLSILICQTITSWFLCPILLGQLESLWKQKRCFISCHYFHDKFIFGCKLELWGLIQSFHSKQVTSLLNKMQLQADLSASGGNQSQISVSVPPTRSDVLHPCDVMEVQILISSFPLLYVASKLTGLY